jgi:hypothetical protein
LLSMAANAQRTCVCAEDALLAADDGTAAVRMLRYIETDGKRRTFASMLHGTMAGGSLKRLDCKRANPATGRLIGNESASRTFSTVSAVEIPK